MNRRRVGVRRIAARMTVSRPRLIRPHQTGFMRGVITDRKDDLHRGRLRDGKDIPGLAAPPFSEKTRSLQAAERQQIDLAGRMAVGAVAVKRHLPSSVEPGLRQKATSGNSKQHTHLQRRPCLRLIIATLPEDGPGRGIERSHIRELAPREEDIALIGRCYRDRPRLVAGAIQDIRRAVVSDAGGADILKSDRSLL